MTPIVALILLVLLLIGPLVAAPLERNIEFYFLVLGVLAAVIARRLTRPIVGEAAVEPLLISFVVLTAGIAFSFTRASIDRAFGRLRQSAGRGPTAAVSVLAIAILAGWISAIVAALVLVEVLGLLRLGEQQRIRICVTGCFAIGIGAGFTPVGMPAATLAVHALKLNFLGLFFLLGPQLIPAIVLCALIAGWFARGPYPEGVTGRHIRERPLDALIQSIKVYVFVAGLVLISESFAPIAAAYVPRLSSPALFWGNMISAAMDNATLVAIEVHAMAPERARVALVSLLISGGMLIPGNVPNIVCAGALGIRSTSWARVGIPLGLALMAIYFVAFVGWR